MLDLNKINFRKLKLRKTFLKSLLFFKAGGLPFRTFFVLQLHAMVSISKRGPRWRTDCKNRVIVFFLFGATLWNSNSEKTKHGQSTTFAQKHASRKQSPADGSEFWCAPDMTLYHFTSTRIGKEWARSGAGGGGESQTGARGPWFTAGMREMVRFWILSATGLRLYDRRCVRFNSQFETHAELQYQCYTKLT